MVTTTQSEFLNSAAVLAIYSEAPRNGTRQASRPSPTTRWDGQGNCGKAISQQLIAIAKRSSVVGEVRLNRSILCTFPAHTLATSLAWLVPGPLDSQTKRIECR